MLSFPTINTTESLEKFLQHSMIPSYENASCPTFLASDLSAPIFYLQVE